VAVEYADPPARHSGEPTIAEFDKHAQKARDDFLLILIANRYKGVMMTADRMNDMGKFRANLQPFKVITYNWWTDPDTDSVIPDSAAYTNLKRPHRVNPLAYP
jgi:hypothetical protein